jgi:ferric-dicitrate binding protein FerR (iron transport regulator)
LEHELNDIDSLISKYLSQEATPEEVQVVNAWISGSDENRRYFQQISMLFEKAPSVGEFIQFDTDAAWKKVRSNLKNNSAGKIRTMGPEKSSLAWIYRVAAGITLFIGVGLYYFINQNTPSTPLEVIAKQNSVTDTLPGGSEVVLNKKTTLKYAFNKKKKLHEVKLKGEAYFNVRHEDDEDFLIEADGVFIRDIGTSFNVKAYPGTDIVEVVVEEGEVIFYTKDNPGIHLQASGKGVYNKKTKKFTIDQPEANVLAYKTRFFIFSGTSLKDVAEELNGVYDSKIIVPERLRNCQVTVSFQDETLEEIAAIIAETLNLKTKVSGKFIELEGSGCE